LASASDDSFGVIREIIASRSALIRSWSCAGASAAAIVSHWDGFNVLLPLGIGAKNVGEPHLGW
jgi:hypothetical protein